MKNYITTTIAASGLFIFIFGMECSAQEVSRITAEIPFDFYVGKELLPKGRYEFERASRQTYPSSLIIRPVKISARRSAMIVATMAKSPHRENERFAVIFNRYGSVYYLSSINAATGGLAVRLFPSSAEKQLARQLVAASTVSIRPGPAPGN